MNPIISVIVPCYNQAHYLSEALDSVLAQTLTNWECVIVNDGSKDNTLEIAKEWARKDERFVVMDKVNEGVSSARNTGLSVTQGEYVCFLDCDDKMSCDALNELLERMDVEIDFVIGGYRICDEQEYVRYKTEDHSEGRISRSKAIEWMYQPEHYHYMGYVCSKLYRRKIIENNRLRFNENLSFNEDRLFAVQYLSKIKGGVRYFTRPVYDIIKHSSSAMASLEDGYNRKFVTDFDAFVLMRKAVAQLPECGQLRMYANQGIIYSYERNHQMMYKFNDYDSRCHWHMVWGMVKTGVIIKYLKKLMIPMMMFLCPRYFCRK